ncbi:MAG: hypothetical protein NVSMB18_35760 [Acetobacteraceae bacterium]
MGGLTSRAPLRGTQLQAAGLFLAVAVAMFSGLVASEVVSSSLDKLETATTRAEGQSDTAADLLETVQEAETTQRGFLLTRRPADLAPYHGALQRIDPLLARLNSLAEGTPWLEAEAALLTTAIHGRLSALAEEVRQAAPGPAAPPGLAGPSPTATGRVEMDTVRATAARIRGQAEAERAALVGKLQTRQRIVGMTMLGALGIGLLLLTAAALRLLWNRAALLRARDGERLEAARLQAAVEHVRDGVAVFGPDGRLTIRNSRFAATIGLTAEQVRPGTPLEMVVAAVDMDPPVLSQPRPAEAPVMTEVRQGARVLEILRSAMPDGGQMIAVADISRRVQAEAIARQAQKMEMIGQMTGGIAHDFNNLLQVVSANIELVSLRLAQSGTDPVLLDRLEAANAGAARGAQLTRHLLAFARRQPLTPEALDPARLLMSMEDMLRRTLGEAVELSVSIGAGLWAMRADPSQMESALLNLTLNARDAMVRGDGIPSGRVVIEVANAALDAGYAGTHDEVAPGHYLMFTVSDNGSGMTPEQLARSMEPFYTTKPDGKGTGLGLPMVFGFAKQSSGHFQLYSEPGVGTTARLYIPRTNAPVESPAPARPLVSRAAGELVLLVEDDVSVRRTAAAALQSLGYTVHEACDGDAALAMLESSLRPDLLFMDVVMPGKFSSREVALRSQVLVPGLAVLFTSGYTQQAVLRDGRIEPGMSLLSKPWRTEDLGRAVRTALDAVRRPRLTPPRRRVLLVEDEALVRMTTADALTDLGFDVLEAASGGAALERLQPPPDLLLTDLGLPDMDGMELIARVHAIVPRLPVVVASGRSEAPEADVVFLAKPYDGGDLRRAVEQALHMPLAAL